MSEAPNVAGPRTLTGNKCSVPHPCAFPGSPGRGLRSPPRPTRDGLVIAQKCRSLRLQLLNRRAGSDPGFAPKVLASRRFPKQSPIRRFLERRPHSSSAYPSGVCCRAQTANAAMNVPSARHQISPAIAFSSVGIRDADGRQSTPLFSLWRWYNLQVNSTGRTGCRMDRDRAPQFRFC